ncbi:hypothetical protein, partial [Pseudoxanthomonas sp. UTMC 1351]|uniref:hypothetical protein n=1 Tax=Pseudoxanthomonas sp. UTMC 1351 TaxID=2695853 RepID=UPI0034CF694E
MPAASRSGGGRPSDDRVFRTPSTAFLKGAYRRYVVVSLQVALDQRSKDPVVQLIQSRLPGLTHGSRV